MRLAAPGEDLVRIGLVADIPDEAVARGVEHIMQRYGELDNAQPGAEMAPGHRDGIDRFGLQFLRKLRQCAFGKLPEILRDGDAVEKGRIGLAGHLKPLLLRPTRLHEAAARGNAAFPRHARPVSAVTPAATRTIRPSRPGRLRRSARIFGLTRSGGGNHDPLAAPGRAPPIAISSSEHPCCPARRPGFSCEWPDAGPEVAMLRPVRLAAVIAAAPALLPAYGRRPAAEEAASVAVAPGAPVGADRPLGRGEVEHDPVGGRAEDLRRHRRLFAGDVNGVDLYRVTYDLVVPERGNKPHRSPPACSRSPRTVAPTLPMVSYQHGTVYGKQEVPSFPLQLTGNAIDDRPVRRPRVRRDRRRLFRAGHVVGAGRLHGQGEPPAGDLRHADRERAPCSIMLRLTTTKLFLGGWSCKAGS